MKLEKIFHWQSVKRASKRLVLTVLLAIHGTGSASVWASINEWTSIGPDGGPIQVLSIDPHTADLYAAVLFRGVFKTTDGAASWGRSGVPTGILVFDPQNPSTMYAVSGPLRAPDYGILKTTDGGASWIAANSGLPTSDGSHFIVFALAIDPRTPSTLYAGTAYGIFKSNDGGTSWSPANSGIPKFATSPGDPVAVDQNRYAGTFELVIDPLNPGTIYAVVEHFNRPGSWVFKTTDGAASWKLASSGLPESRMILAIDPQSSDTLYAGTGKGVFKTMNGAASWAPVNSGLPDFVDEPYTPVSALVSDPLKPATLYATIANLSTGKVFKSTNGGESWVEADGGLPDTTYIDTLLISPENPATLYAGTGYGVFKSTDGAANWIAVNSGLRATSISSLATDPRIPGVLYAATDHGIMKSSDGGTVWSQQSAIGAAELAVDPQNSNTLYALSYDCLGPCSAGQRSYFGIFKSMDGGASWDRLWSVANSSNPISNWGRTLAIDPQNPANIYATTQGYWDECGNEMLHKTVDGGVSWAESAFNFGWCALALVVDPRTPSTLYAGFELGGVLKSTDAGATWTVANSGLPPSYPAQSSAQGWSLAGSGQPLGAVVSLAVDPQNPDTLYAVVGQDYGSWSIFKTTDAAASWKPAGSGLPSDWSSNLDCCYRPSLAVDPQHPNNVYVGMVIAGVHRVFRTADGGASWVDSGLAVPSGYGWFGGLAVSTQNASSVYAGTASQGVFAITFAPEP